MIVEENLLTIWMKLWKGFLETSGTSCGKLIVTKDSKSTWKFTKFRKSSTSWSFQKLMILEWVIKLSIAIEVKLVLKHEFLKQVLKDLNSFKLVFLPNNRKKLKSSTLGSVLILRRALQSKNDKLLGYLLFFCVTLEVTLGVEILKNSVT